MTTTQSTHPTSPESNQTATVPSASLKHLPLLTSPESGQTTVPGTTLKHLPLLTSPESGQTTVPGTTLKHLPLLTSPASPELWPGFAPPVLPNKSRIIYPEFVNFLVHPEVDSFKDLPKLPGQSDSPPPHLRLAWSADISGWSDGTTTVLDQSSSQNWNIPARGRFPL